MLSFSGFLPESDCNNKTNIDYVNIYRIWELTCPEIEDLPAKNLYLRDHFAGFLRGSQTIFECAAGHELSDEVST